LYLCSYNLVGSVTPRKVQESCLLVGFLVLVRVSLLVFSVSSRMVPACFFYSLKEVQGYKMLVCERSLLEKQP
jgi:hypothetical protein